MKYLLTVACGVFMLVAALSMVVVAIIMPYVAEPGAAVLVSALPFFFIVTLGGLLIFSYFLFTIGILESLLADVNNSANPEININDVGHLYIIATVLLLIAVLIFVVGLYLFFVTLTPAVAATVFGATGGCLLVLVLFALAIVIKFKGVDTGHRVICDKDNEVKYDHDNCSYNNVQYNYEIKNENDMTP